MCSRSTTVLQKEIFKFFLTYSFENRRLYLLYSHTSDISTAVNWYSARNALLI